MVAGHSCEWLLGKTELRTGAYFQAINQVIYAIDRCKCTECAVQIVAEYGTIRLALQVFFHSLSYSYDCVNGKVHVKPPGIGIRGEAQANKFITY